ncbi:MAG: hypothetical protein ACLFT0_19310 [Spirulinaceae cyanobacterium]
MILKKHWQLLTFIPPILLLLAVGLAKVLFQLPIYELMGDTASVAKVHPFTGLISNIGVLLWCGAATICFFVAGALRRTRNSKKVNFFLASACLSTYLLIDDFFLFHEELAPNYIGISQDIVVVLIIIAVLMYFFWFRRIILQTRYGLILIAAGLLAASIAVDTILKPWLLGLGEWRSLIEDGAKLLGITSWLSYYMNTAYQFLFDNFGNSLANTENKTPVFSKNRG